MRIGIDARLAAYRAGGIAEHTSHLLLGLRRLAPPEKVVVLAHRRAAARGRGSESPYAPFEARFLATPPHHRLEGLLLPLEAAPARLDLLHCPDVVLPRLWRGPGVTTVHDLAFLRRPDLLTPDSRAYYGRVHDSVRRAERVIAVSEHTRSELLALTDVDPRRVRVVPNAVHPRYLEAPDESHDREVRRRFVGDRRYILFVGTIEPRKGVPTLLRAYRSLGRGAGDVALLVVGHRGWLSEPVFALADDLGLERDKVFAGPAAPGDLAPLYRGAAALAHPAVDEGFGLTVLEAMACGAPVIASSAGALREVAGDAALFAPPDDVAAWSEALASVLCDAALARQLGAEGRRRAKEYTVERQAEATLAVYREVIAGRGLASESTAEAAHPPPPRRQ